MLLPTIFSACKYIYLSEISFATKTNKEKKRDQQEEDETFFQRMKLNNVIQISSKAREQRKKEKKNQKRFKTEGFVLNYKFPIHSILERLVPLYNFRLEETQQKTSLWARAIWDGN